MTRPEWSPTCPIPSLKGVQGRLCLDLRAARATRSAWNVATESVVLYECPVTGMRFRKPPEAEAVQAFYGPDYHQHIVGLEDSSARRKACRVENAARIAYLKRYCASGRVLDVGCSTGLLARQLAEAGFDVWATDVSEFACRRADELLGHERVFCGPVEQWESQAGERRFDAITLMDVIEHFEDPVAPMSAIRELLVPGGILLLRTPTLSSPFYTIADWSYAWSGRRYTHAIQLLYHAEHLYYFNEPSIRRLLEELGFEILAIVPDPLRWISFRTAECRHGLVVNLGLAAVYWASRLAGGGHGMKVVARRPRNLTAGDPPSPAVRGRAPLG